MTAAALEQPRHDASRDPTVATAHAAMSSLLRHGIPPSPAHFAIWFDYHAGDNVLLRRVIDTYISNGKPITEALLAEIHGRFFDTRRESEALIETSRRLNAATGEVVELLAEAGGQSCEYGRSLGAFGQALAQPAGNLAAALARMCAATEEMAERSACLGARLEASTRIVAELQARLEEATREARTDALTGLPNRRAIEQEAARLATLADAEGRPLAVALFDIDRFKALNDAWGHPVGDAVLRHVAVTLQEAAAAAFLCGRFGGEEFCALLPGHDLATALEAAERLRLAVAGQTYSVRATGRNLGAVTVSAGVAVRAPQEGWGRLTARADAALYRAKQAGRNRVAWDAG